MRDGIWDVWEYEYEYRYENQYEYENEYEYKEGNEYEYGIDMHSHLVWNYMRNDVKQRNEMGGNY